MVCRRFALLSFVILSLLSIPALAQPPGGGFGPPGMGMETAGDPFRLPFPFDASNLDFMFGGMRGPGGPMGGPERKLVAQFDKDGDKRLNTEERKAAREFNKTSGGGGRGFGPPGGMGGPGFMPGGPGGGREPSKPGPRLTPADVTPVAENIPLYDAASLRTLFLTF
jgi:hypothetical protein